MMELSQKYGVELLGPPPGWQRVLCERPATPRWRFWSSSPSWVIRRPLRGDAHMEIVGTETAISSVQAE